jgi:hypothetical protein
MGQYYKPVNLDKKEYLYTHDFDEGLKLMEHSYIANPVLNAVEKLLLPNGKWYKNRILWAGDYADHEKGYKKTNEGYDVNIYQIVDNEGKKIKPSSKKVDEKFCYLTNHSKKQFIDLRKIKADSDGYKIHPLPLLTAEGNGRGGGDFRGEDSRIGKWARDIISLEKHIADNYLEINGQFKDN